MDNPTEVVLSEDFPQGDFAQLLQKEIEKDPKAFLDGFVDLAADQKLMP